VYFRVRRSEEISNVSGIARKKQKCYTHYKLANEQQLSYVVKWQNNKLLRINDSKFSLLISKMTRGIALREYNSAATINRKSCWDKWFKNYQRFCRTFETSCQPWPNGVCYISYKYKWYIKLNKYKLKHIYHNGDVSLKT